jgi:hypothetical protein
LIEKILKDRFVIDQKHFLRILGFRSSFAFSEKKPHNTAFFLAVKRSQQEPARGESEIHIFPKKKPSQNEMASVRLKKFYAVLSMSAM